MEAARQEGEKVFQRETLGHAIPSLSGAAWGCLTQEAAAMFL